MTDMLISVAGHDRPGAEDGGAIACNEMWHMHAWTSVAQIVVAAEQDSTDIMGNDVAMGYRSEGTCIPCDHDVCVTTDNHYDMH